jgi:hypothetical protein
LSDTQLVNGQTYYYVVSALSGASESGDPRRLSPRPTVRETAVGNPPTTAALASFGQRHRQEQRVGHRRGIHDAALSLGGSAEGWQRLLLSGSRFPVPSLAAGQTRTATPP